MRTSNAAEHQELMAELRRVGSVAPSSSGGADDPRPGLLERLKRWLSSGGGA